MYWTFKFQLKTKTNLFFGFRPENAPFYQTKVLMQKIAIISGMEQLLLYSNFYFVEAARRFDWIISIFGSCCTQSYKIHRECHQH